jgi:hypothetical protein
MGPGPMAIVRMTPGPTAAPLAEEPVRV